MKSRKKPRLGILSHGYWWGPNWSAGARQDSVDYRDLDEFERVELEPIDYNDESAMYHDAEYAIANAEGDTNFSSRRKQRADFIFAKRGFKSGTILGTLGAIAVGAQGLARGIASAVQQQQHSIPNSISAHKSKHSNIMSERGRSKHRSSSRMSTGSQAPRRQPRDVMPRKMHGEKSYQGGIGRVYKKAKSGKSPDAIYGARSVVEDNFEITANDENLAIFGFTSPTRQLATPNTGVTDLRLTNPLTIICMSLIKKYLKKYFNISVENPELPIHQHVWWITAGGEQDKVDMPIGMRLWHKLTRTDVNNAESGSDTVFGFHDVTFRGDAVAFTTGGANNWTINLRQAAFQMASLLTYPEYGSRGPFTRQTITENTTADAAVYANAGEFTGELFGCQMIQGTMDNTVNGTWVITKVFGMENLQNQYVSFRQNYKIHVENTTLHDAGGTALDVIGQNPLKCKMYAFNDAMPEVKSHIQQYTNFSAGTGLGRSFFYPVNQETRRIMYDDNGDGIIQPSAALPEIYGSQFPPTDMFANCHSHGSFNIEPGKVKSFNHSYSYKGKLVTFIKKMCYSQGEKLQIGTTAVPYNWSNMWPGGGNVDTGPANANSDQWTLAADRYKFGGLAVNKMAHGRSILLMFDHRMPSGTQGIKIQVSREIYTAGRLTYNKVAKLTTMPIMRGETVTAGADDTTI